ncbi:MAG: hypothetical protein PHE56_04260 [Bacteroidales bacterium]|nr:hypothetical protein [Bacteroidales bacterium]
MMMNKDLNGIKNKNKLALSSIVLAAFIAFGCASSEIADSRDVNQKKIHQSYSVTYDASGDGSYAVWAQFRFGGNKGTTLKLSEPSTITVNGESMEEDQSDFYGCSYGTRIKGTNKFSFKFIDTEKTEYVNTITVLSAEPKQVKVINANRESNIYWIGNKLEKDETITVIIEDKAGARAEASTDIVGTDYIVVKPDDLQNLVNGDGQIYFQRIKSISTQQAADEGGSIWCEYNSEKIPVRIHKKQSTETGTEQASNQINQ